VNATSQPCRLELLTEHVSKAFETESEANGRAADRVEDVPYGRMRLIRIEFDDIDAFMRATLQPARSIGWLGMARNGTSRLAIPLIMAEAPMNHTNNLEGGLKGLFGRTERAVRKAVRGPHHHLLCLGTLLFSANFFLYFYTSSYFTFFTCHCSANETLLSARTMRAIRLACCAHAHMRLLFRLHLCTECSRSPLSLQTHMTPGT
jgi:hypothetical protein